MSAVCSIYIHLTYPIMKRSEDCLPGLLILVLGVYDWNEVIDQYPPVLYEFIIFFLFPSVATVVRADVFGGTEARFCFVFSFAAGGRTLLMLFPLFFSVRSNGRLNTSAIYWEDLFLRAWAGFLVDGVSSAAEEFNGLAIFVFWFYLLVRGWRRRQAVNLLLLFCLI